MSNLLQQRFLEVLDLASARLADKAPSRDRGGLRILSGGAHLRELVESLEGGPAFAALVQETATLFDQSGKPRRTHGWVHAVRHWFRRSGLYQRIAAGERTVTADELSAYQQEFSRQTIEVTYVAPLEYVNFAVDEMDFGPFSILYLSPERLDSMLQNPTRAVFYPSAHVPTQKLSGYWWLMAREQQSRSSRLPPVLPDFEVVELQHTAHPPPIARALDALILYPWTQGEEMGPWTGFGVPFVLRFDDDLCSYPRGAIPDLRVLSREPDIDPATQEERGDHPLVLYPLDSPSETTRFQAFTQDKIDRLTRLLGATESRQRIEIGLGFLRKGFFAADLEQLVWHITAIDALLGDSGAGATKRLAKRVAKILADSPQKADRLRELYAIRSAWIHGKPPSQQVRAEHLRAAREIARKTTVSFIRWIDEVDAKVGSKAASDTLPNREELLRFLDLSVSERQAIQWLADAMPVDFPVITAWMS